MEQTRAEYGEVVKEVLEYLRANKHPLVKVMDNGLLYAIPKSGANRSPRMDSTIDGYPVVDRQGYIVEYNALWYNALLL